MTPADKLAADALARHFAYESGGFWEHLDPREQAVYRARALDVVQVVSAIYQPRIKPYPNVTVGEGAYETATFPRPMSKENDR